MTENNPESPANLLIEELTKEKSNRSKIVKTICAALLLLSIGAAAGAFVFTYKYVQKIGATNEINFK